MIIREMMVSFLFYLGSTLCALYSLFFCDSFFFFFCFLMLFNYTFSSSVIEIYKKKKKTLLKSYYFYLEIKMRMQKSEIFMGFTFIICINY